MTAEVSISAKTDPLARELTSTVASGPSDAGDRAAARNTRSSNPHLVTEKNLATAALLAIDDESGSQFASGQAVPVETQPRSFWRFIETFVSTLVVFGLFFVQAILVARVLGPAARGEFGAILYFPRDLLLYVGLWGGVELMTSQAAQFGNSRRLKQLAMRLAIFTGVLTAIVATSLSAVVLGSTDKFYLVGWCAVVACYLPLEHLQLVVSAVDRGSGNFRRYNRDRILFAAAFPILVLAVFGPGLDQTLFSSPLQGICLLWILSRFIGLLPTVWDAWGADRSPSSTTSAAILGRPSQLGRKQIRPHEVSLPQLLRQGRSFGVSVLANELFERVDLLLIILLATLDQAGQYFVTIPIATLMVLLPNTVSLFAFNWGAQRAAVFSARQIVGVTCALLLFQVLSCVVLLALLPWLIHTFYGADFELAISFSQWLLPIAIIRGLVQIVDAYAKGSGIVSWTIGARIASLVVALLVVGLTYSHWQLFSIPLGMAAGQLLSLLVIGWGCWRENTARSKATDPLGGAR